MNDTPSETELPTPLYVVQTYRNVLREIVAALHSGTKHAQWYADVMDEPIDNGIAPALVRKGAKRHLLKVGTDVTNEEQLDYQPEFLANLGLAVTSDELRIRVLRSDAGSVPVPGPSKARQAFYRQETYLPGLEPETTPAVPSQLDHVVLHWDTDDEYNLSRVYLALPLAGNTTRESVLVEWNEIIWRRQVPVIDGQQAHAQGQDFDIYLDIERRG